MAKRKRTSDGEAPAAPTAAPELVDVLRAHGMTLVRERIGTGGSAFVHQAKATRSTERVTNGQAIAVKEYKQSVLDIPGQLERIRQEADLGGTLEHPNIVRTFGLVMPADRELGRHLLFLEWIDGATLDSWYRKSASPPQWSTIQQISLDIVGAVGALHDRGVFHRDIKPENVMVRDQNSAVLMDIGVAEITGNNEHTLHTSVKDFVGSVRFASPQFILGEAFQAADDVYSIGATFYFLFTGRMPYEDVQRKPVLPIQVTTAPPKIDSLQSDIPKPMKVLLEACCHRDRKRRPTLEELRDCLQNPAGAPFIARELALQSQASRSYPVLQVLSDGAEFFADLGGDTPTNGGHFDVVRRSPAIHVPSYDQKVSPEIWIAEAVLKHSHQNVGYFKVMGKRWQEPKPSAMSAIRSTFEVLSETPGYWVDSEKITRKVEQGDLVLKQ